MFKSFSENQNSDEIILIQYPYYTKMLKFPIKLYCINKTKI